jgi:hypothetical protein
MQQQQMAGRAFPSGGGGAFYQERYFTPASRPLLARANLVLADYQDGARCVTKSDTEEGDFSID